MAIHIEEAQAAPRHARASPVRNVLSSLLVPFRSLRVVLGHPVSVFVHLSDANLRIHNTLFGRPQEPVKSPLVVALNKTSYSGLATAGLLRYRFNKADQRTLLISSYQEQLFAPSSSQISTSPSRKYRRQSFYSSEQCGPEHNIPWNKSFDPSSCVYIAGRCTAVQRSIEALPNRVHLSGNFEAVRAPYQRERADSVFGDVLFLWWQLD